MHQIKFQVQREVAEIQHLDCFASSERSCNSLTILAKARVRRKHVWSIKRVCLKIALKVHRADKTNFETLCYHADGTSHKESNIFIIPKSMPTVVFIDRSVSAWEKPLSAVLKPLMEYTENPFYIRAWTNQLFADLLPCLERIHLHSINSRSKTISHDTTQNEDLTWVAICFAT